MTVAGAATPNGGSGRDGDGDGDARIRGDADGAEYVNPMTKPPYSSSSSSSSSASASRTRGKKRPRSPTQATAAAERAEEEEEADAAACSSPITVTHPTEPMRKESPSMPLLSGEEAHPSPLLPRRCDRLTQASERDLRPPARTSPHRKAQTTLPPCVVPPLTADCDGREDVPEGPALARTTRRKRGRSLATEDIESTSPLERASSPAGAGAGHGTPTVARVASLEFAGKPSWKVSSVVVTSAGGGGGRSPGAATASPTATVVVCHSGGVSVWGLTDAGAVCTHLSPALAGATKEAISGSLLAAAVVGGDPAGVTPSATRAPGGDETCIVAIGRHGTDPGLPIFRVWQQQQQQPLPPQDDEERFGGRASRHGTGGAAVREKAAPAATATPPAVLTMTLKKKFSKFFPPLVPRHVLPRHIWPCLCVCGYERAAAAAMANGLEKESGVNAGAAGEDSGAGPAGEITAVMALGGKVLKLVFGAGRRGAQAFSAKSLTTGVATEGKSVAHGSKCISEP